MEIEEVVKTYTIYLLKLSYLYVKDKQIAEDIVQEVFLKFYKNQAAYQEEGKIKQYLTVMTVNQCKDYVKSWAYRKVIIKEKLTRSHVETAAMILKEERQTIANAVLALPIKYREPIIFYYYEERNILEIAELLHLSDNTVKTRLREARRRLHHVLATDDWEVLQIEEQ
ncbi:RNA polymerase subunit sigma [Lysinibacillus alkalisoli]|uniref:RNA polymerase subunit sigma n=1 Tax=Lysinibacillus alkalisoli TaxID=1911548 RepID=A0A917LDA4_9BACI|nr:sigma-70 family RNA polymerase sigma factor [Lysinibacillus alkalisoli]GGG14658.1 RNA polymerase subunit sigma [Lysinibacillus alkalisoli]